MIRTLDRVLTRATLLPTAAALSALIVLYLIGDLFSLGMDLIEHRPPLDLILRYGITQSLYMGSFFVPLALLIGTFWGFCEWRQNQEWLASLGSGRHPLSLLRGPLLFILLVSLVLFGISWFSLADLSQTVQSLRGYELRDREVPSRNVLQNVNFQLMDSRSLRAERFHLDENRLLGVTVLQEENGSLRARWDTGEIRFEAGIGWKGENVDLRNFLAGEIEEETVVESVSFPLETPRVLETVLMANPRTADRRPEGYSVNELRTLIAFQQRRGNPATEERAHLHWKISFPMSAALFGLFGLLLGTRTRLNKPAGLGFCLAGVFVYMVFHSFFFAWFQNITVPDLLTPFVPLLAAYFTPLIAAAGLVVGYRYTD